MSTTTYVCPECGHRDTINADGLSSRYELPCQGCGWIFTPRDDLPDVRTLDALIRQAMRRIGIHYAA